MTQNIESLWARDFLDEDGELRFIADDPLATCYDETEHRGEDPIIVGPYVDLAKRATHLTLALNAASRASQLEGLLKSNLPGKIIKAGGRDVISQKKFTAHKTLKSNIGLGAGMDEMVRSGAMTQLDADDAMVAMAKEFRDKYTAYGARALNGRDVTLQVKRDTALKATKDRHKFREQLQRQNNSL